jgi:Phosphate transporter family
MLINDIGTEMAQFKELSAVPRTQVRNFRNDMYLVSEALRLIQKSGKPIFAAADVAILKNYKSHVDKATRFIPLWVKVAVALALGLGAMVGWKRIVVTVGEKIGKNHLTYAQFAAAEITAMATIGAADGLGLPASTTHVLSSGVAGHYAREFIRLADEHGAQPVAGLGTDVACRDDAIGLVVLRVPEPVPGRLTSAEIALLDSETKGLDWLRASPEDASIRRSIFSNRDGPWSESPGPSRGHIPTTLLTIR